LIAVCVSEISDIPGVILPSKKTEGEALDRLILELVTYKT
jgi:hypothetical protein